MSSTGNHPASQFVENPSPNDVLFGRGSHINNHEGNKRFRTLIHLKTPEYTACKTNYEKDVLARHIGAAVVRHGGRFLQKTPHRHAAATDQEVWEIVGERSALLKIKQAFRDNARITEVSQTTYLPRRSESQAEGSRLRSCLPAALNPGSSQQSFIAEHALPAIEGALSTAEQTAAHQRTMISAGVAHPSDVIMARYLTLVNQQTISTMGTAPIAPLSLPSAASTPWNQSRNLTDGASIETAQMRHLSLGLQQQMHEQQERNQKVQALLDQQRLIRAAQREQENRQFTAALRAQQAALLQIQQRQPARPHEASAHQQAGDQSRNRLNCQRPGLHTPYVHDAGNDYIASDAVPFNMMHMGRGIMHPSLRQQQASLPQQSALRIAFPSDNTSSILAQVAGPLDDSLRHRDLHERQATAAASHFEQLRDRAVEDAVGTRVEDGVPPDNSKSPDDRKTPPK